MGGVGGGGRTHCGEGAPQSTHLLFSFVLEMVRSLERVSGSTSHILEVMLVRFDGVECEGRDGAAIGASLGVGVRL